MLFPALLLVIVCWNCLAAVAAAAAGDGGGACAAVTDVFGSCRCFWHSFNSKIVNLCNTTTSNSSNIE